MARTDAQIAQLEAQYMDEIGSWDWAAVKAEAESNLEPDYDSPDQLRGSCYLGTVFSLMPSGKFYTPWACSNVEESEAQADEIYMDRLESIASSHGLSIESGEGDPCDLFAVLYRASDDSDE